TDAERILWQALTRDRRFAGLFKRQTPVGRHIPDFVSFVHRLAIELVNANESEAIVADRAGRKTWLEARDYRVIEMRVGDVERDLAAELGRLESKRLEGEWLKNCNCAFGCPCDFNARPTEGYCEGLVGMRITKGHFENTKLDGVVFAAVVHFPGALHEGNGQLQPIIDERATPEQREA